MRLIIGLTGLAGSGKTTVAKHLCNRHGFERVRFAGPLKDMMRALGLSDAEIDGDRKEQPCDLLCGKTPRWAMQSVGTEWGRELIGPDIWIRAWRAAVDRLPSAVPVVVDDCRFPNEADTIRAMGGYIVAVKRPNASNVASEHVSEGQDLGLATMTLQNTSTVRALLEKADVMIRILSWIGHTH